MKNLIKQIMRFGVVGVISFLVDYGILYVLTEKANIYYLLSAGISFTASVVINYLLSMSWVFKSNKKRGKKEEFIIFVVLSLGGLLLNQVMMYVFVDYMNVYYLLAKIVATAIVMIYNFISRKLILER